MAHIFVSHASKDDEPVTRIHDALEAATGRSLWVDHKDIGPGDHWQTSIDNALRDCESLLLALSRNSAQRDEVTAEWRDALLRGHKVYIAILDDVPLEDIPSRLRIISMVNLHTDWGKGLSALVATLTGEPLPADAPVNPARLISGEIQASLLGVPIQGREDDLKQITAHLNTGRPTQILGVGGLGKSRLAAELALTYPAVDGAIWLHCDDTSTVDDFIYRMREHFELKPTDDRPVVLAQFRSKKRLVVIDNAESIPDDDPRRPAYTQLVNQLAANGAHVLLTSRLEWEDIEQPYRIHRPAALSADAGTEVARVMAEAFQAPAVANDPAAFAEAARQHAGLIDWGARQTNKRELETVLNELRSLQGKRLDDVLDDMIHKSLRAMTAAEGSTPEAVLRRLAVCRGGFTYQAAQAICESYKAELEDALLTLQAWQFVRFDPITQRRSLDPLAEAVLTPDESAHQPHYAFYRAMTKQHDDKQDYFGLDMERDNLTVAFEWAIGGDGEDALWLANMASDYLYNRGRFNQILNWSERTVSVLINHPNKLLWASAQNSLGSDYQSSKHLGDGRDKLHKSIAAYQAALQYRTVQTAPLDYAITQNNLGNTYSDLAEVEDETGNLQRAITAYEAALIYFTPQTTPLAYATTQNNLGTTYRRLSEIEDPVDNLQRAIAAYEAALIYRLPQIVPLDYATTHYNLALAHRSQSKLKNQNYHLNKAISHYKEALRFWTPQTAPINYAKTMWGMGIDYQSLSDISNAIACWREAERCFRQMDMVERADLMRRWIEEVEGGG